MCSYLLGSGKTNLLDSSTTFDMCNLFISSAMMFPDSKVLLIPCHSCHPNPGSNQGSQCLPSGDNVSRKLKLTSDWDSHSELLREGKRTAEKRGSAAASLRRSLGSPKLWKFHPNME